MSWETYDALLSVRGTTPREIEINTNRVHFEDEMVRNPGYKADCKRNGIPQRFVVDRNEVSYKYKFIAFPGEQIAIGDIIECDGLFFLVTDSPRMLNEITLAAIGWQCNCKFRWQNGTPDIIERWGVLYSGVYSTTKTNDDQLSVLNKQYKMYLPYDDDTKKLYVDKRMAVDIRYDKRGNEILEAYAITGFNRIAKGYGSDAHLLICELKSSTYSKETDSLEEMICDYIKQGETAAPSDDLVIDGRDTIRIGASRRYTAKRQDGTAVPNVSWSIDKDEIGSMQVGEDGMLTLSAKNDTSICGALITIRAEEENGDKAEKTVEVIS